MAKLQAIEIEDGTVIYVETTEDIETPAIVEEAPEGAGRTAKGGSLRPAEQMIQNFQAIESTIRIYTTYTLNAFRQMSAAEVRKVNLEFGVNVSGVGGIPYIATGTAGCNIKVSVECEFPKPEADKPAI